jgi:hypothetical protein
VYLVVTFEAKRSVYLDRLCANREWQHLAFVEVPTEFEFLLNSNFYLRVSRR